MGNFLRVEDLEVYQRLAIAGLILTLGKLPWGSEPSDGFVEVGGPAGSDDVASTTSAVACRRRRTLPTPFASARDRLERLLAGRNGSSPPAAVSSRWHFPP